MASNNVNLCVVLTFLIACISSANGIAGGKPATQPGHFEYVAAYTWRAHSHTYGCAGAIVSKHYILTLASKALNIIDLNATIYVGAQKLGPQPRNFMMSILIHNILKIRLGMILH